MGGAFSIPVVFGLFSGAAAAGVSEDGSWDPDAWDPDAWDLIRVDEPAISDALATSQYGSVLADPPLGTGLAWRVESIPEVDEVTAWEAQDALQSWDWVDAEVDGTGVKVAVFDIQWTGAQMRLDELGEVSTHDCWAHRSCEPEMDTLRPRFSFELGSHGVACAEVIRDIAPGVELHLVRVNGLTTLENAVDWAIREEIDVISMSMSFFNESFYDGTGAVNEQMDKLAEAGVLMVTSAGNYAEQHWTETFSDTDGDGQHEFRLDEDTTTEFLPIYFKTGTRKVHLIWNDFSNCGDTDLDAFVIDKNYDVVGWSNDVQHPAEDGCWPVERVRVSVEKSGWYWLSVVRTGGVPHVSMDIMARGGEVYNAMAEASITDPGTHPQVLTVGAVRADDYLFNQPEHYSSRGPTHAGLDKPDLAGPDGLTTTVYGATGFYGTSASTPAVAAAVALVMSQEPGRTGAQAAQILMDGAFSQRSTWQAADQGLGAGHVRLPSPSAKSRGCGEGLLFLSMVFWWPFLRWENRPGRRQRH